MAKKKHEPVELTESAQRKADKMNLRKKTGGQTRQAAEKISSRHSRNDSAMSMARRAMNQSTDSNNR